jgi:cytoskeletal protein RodZ
VLVYEKLFCETAEEDNTDPFVAGSDNDKSNSDSQIRKTMKKKLLVVIGGVVVFILAILGILLLKMGNKTTVQSGTEHNTPSGSVSNNVSETIVIKDQVNLLPNRCQWVTSKKRTFEKCECRRNASRR